VRAEIAARVPAERAATEAVVRRYCDAWEKGDVATLVGCYGDDMVLHYFGANPLAGAHRGKPAVLRALAQVQARTQRRLVEIHDVLASDGHAVVLARERFERDGRALELDRVFVYHVAGDRFVECWVFDEDQRAVDAFLS
jgi:ketosteroid isomerase-like protein